MRSTDVTVDVTVDRHFPKYSGRCIDKGELVDMCMLKQAQSFIMVYYGSAYNAVSAFHKVYMTDTSKSISACSVTVTCFCYMCGACPLFDITRQIP